MIKFERRGLVEEQHSDSPSRVARSCQTKSFWPRPSRTSTPYRHGKLGIVDRLDRKELSAGGEIGKVVQTVLGRNRRRRGRPGDGEICSTAQG
jgi:hypothetical protein